MPITYLVKTINKDIHVTCNQDNTIIDAEGIGSFWRGAELQDMLTALQLEYGAAKAIRVRHGD